MRNGARAITADALQVLLQSVDVIREMTQSAQAKQPIVMTGPNALSGELARILAQRVAPSAVADTSAAASEAPPAVPAAQSTVAPRIVQPVKRAAALTGPLEGWRIVFAPDVSLFKTCNDPMRIFDELANLGPLEVTANVDNVPNMSDLEPTQCFLSWTLLLRGAIEHARVAEVFDWVDASSKIAYEPIYGVSSSSAATDGPAADLPQSAAPRSAGASDLHAAPPSAAKSGGESGSLRVATEKVDALINLVGELVITQSMLGRFAEKYEPEDIEALRRSLAQLTRNTRELQESVMQIRMLPIGF
jgi:two-component system chemotaxis sensor kinase CheA